ncbi:putative ATP-grasp-modified RiPP [Kitasatospora sp. NPDC051170]|uniref:putative ATP-grasp-modified RiPP n=1 Tax=Kitasatospora sp. NPDC051170 TaxID=3364056 RepID=UPI0037B6DD7F
MIRTPVPWGISRMGPYAATATLPAFTSVIDPETQIAVSVDEHGRTVELGSHGTNTSGVTATQTVPGDGAKPGGPTDADSYESYDQDQSNG